MKLHRELKRDSHITLRSTLAVCPLLLLAGPNKTRIFKKRLENVGFIGAFSKVSPRISYSSSQPCIHDARLPTYHSSRGLEASVYAFSPFSMLLLPQKFKPLRGGMVQDNMRCKNCCKRASCDFEMPGKDAFRCLCKHIMVRLFVC